MIHKTVMPILTCCKYHR